MCQILYVLCILAVSITSTVSQATTGISIQTVISNAVRDYKDGKYAESIDGFQKGLVHYRMLKHIDINCGIRCNAPDIAKELGRDMTGLDHLVEYGNMIAQANCVKICKEEHPFSKSNIERPSPMFTADFERREPYNYLQFAYYKVGKIKEACRAAHTYLQVNHDDKQMLENMEFYRGLDEVDDSYFVDLEGKPYVESFLAGVRAYEIQDYKSAIDNLEKALYHYFNAVQECQASCYIGKETLTFPRFAMAVAGRYLHAVNCTSNCHNKLRPLVGSDLLEKFVAKTFSYLQFAYYQTGKWTMAVPAGASVLLLDPNDEMAKSNFEYYTEHGAEHDLVPEIHYQPRADAVKYQLEKSANEELLGLLQQALDDKDEEEVEEEDVEFEGLDADLVEEIAQQITVTLGERLRGDIG